MLKNGAIESQVIAALHDEFLRDARQRFVQMVQIREDILRSETPKVEIASFRAELHTMKGVGEPFGFASITLIGRRLEEFLKPMSVDELIANADISTFLIAIGEIVESGDEPSDDDLEGILNSLPMSVLCSD